MDHQGMTQYRDMAEAHAAELRRLEAAANRRLLALEWVIGLLGTAGFFMGVFAGSFLEMPALWRACLIAAGALMLCVSTAAALKIEQTAGYYECPACGERYVPTLTAVFLAPHIGRARWMKCPKCARRAFQKKVLTR